ncbi:MAG: hypothetical protein HKP32_01065 [Woeseia sp.]|nr:hypothetical protein [Gammaproteobacteria bacterium]NNL50600.1 hypothetical protein [Woeseiaceae bacterium]NNL53722.1 hypothetical protein [Woeseia sp.]
MTIRSVGIFLAVSSVFLYGYSLPGSELNLFAGVIVLVLAAMTFTVGNNSLFFNRNVLITLVVILVVGSIGILLGRGSMSAYLTQAFVISLVVICSTIVISGAGELAAKIFPTYLILSFAFALIALLELILGLFGVYFEFLTPEIDYVFGNVHRITGLAAEPAHFVHVMTPSVVAILISAFSNRLCMSPAKSLVIVVSYILTFSSLGFFVITLVLLAVLFWRTSLSSMAVKIILAAGLIGVFSAIPQINTRALDTYNVLVSSEIENVNVSSLTIYKNFRVAIQSGINQPIFGAGLGGHEHNYYKYLPAHLSQDKNFNDRDASSLFLRLISEFGIPFTVLFYWFALAFWTGFPDRDDLPPIYWKKLTSTAVLFLIIARSARGGNFITHGFPFFLILYYSVYSSLKTGDLPSIVFPKTAKASGSQ